MGSQVVMMALFFGLFAGYGVWMMSKRKKAMANVGPALRSFFERTGYRYVELPNGTLDDQVRLGEQRTQELMRGTGGNEQHLVRNFHGLPVYSYQYSGAGTEPNQRVFSAKWTSPLQAPPRILWEVAEKSLVGVRKALGEAFSSTTRGYAPTYPHVVPTGDPQLDGRFFVYAEDPRAVQHLLAQNPRLRELLLASTEVCLMVRPQEVVFSDPFQKNVLAGMGGTVGAMAVGFDPARGLELSIPVHDRMAELLATAAQASA